MRGFISLFLAWCSPQINVRRYKVTPRRNPRVFRREMLAALVRKLELDTSRTAHGA